MLQQLAHFPGVLRGQVVVQGEHGSRRSGGSGRSLGRGGRADIRSLRAIRPGPIRSGSPAAPGKIAAMTHQDLPLGRHVDYPREYDAAPAVPDRARARPRPYRHRRRRPAVHRHRPLACLRAELARRPRQAACRHGDHHGAGDFAEPGRIQVAQAVPQFLQRHALRQRRRRARAHRARPVRVRPARPVEVAFGLPPIDESAAGNAVMDCIDGLDVDDRRLRPAERRPPRGRRRRRSSSETLTSALLKSNCPVTGQPDWARVVIAYRGPKLDRAGLLRYLVSFRDHAEFHEQCVERIFSDLLRTHRPQQLSVEARYTRRGGLDINPWRATPGHPAPPRGATSGSDRRLDRPRLTRCDGSPRIFP